MVAERSGLAIGLAVGLALRVVVDHGTTVRAPPSVRPRPRPMIRVVTRRAGALGGVVGTQEATALRGKGVVIPWPGGSPSATGALLILSARIAFLRSSLTSL